MAQDHTEEPTMEDNDSYADTLIRMLENNLEWQALVVIGVLLSNHPDLIPKDKLGKIRNLFIRETRRVLGQGDNSKNGIDGLVDLERIVTELAKDTEENVKNEA